MSVPVMTKHRPERRTGLHCPSCGSSSVERETTIRGTASSVAFRCNRCEKSWQERRAS